MEQPEDSKTEPLIEACKKIGSAISEVSPNPSYLSPDWHDYVMSQFAPDELVEGFPNVAGLRRVSELLLGPVSSSKPTQVFPQTTEGPPRATVVYEIYFPCFLNFLGSRTFGDVADVWVGNTDNIFAAFAASTACTRAEARCFRKALRLKVCAAEELPKLDISKEVNTVVASTNEEAGRISEEQILFLNKKCKDLGIDVFAFINSGENKYRSISGVTREIAAKMIKRLGEYKKDKASIPEEIKGYKENWRV